MEKRVLSFRVSEAEITALEALQQPEDSSLSQTALRLLRSLLGLQMDTTVNAVDTDGIKDRVESLEEKLTDAIVSREQLSDFVNDIVDKRIQLALDTLSDHENRLLDIEQAPVTGKATTQESAPALPQEELESAIAPEVTQQDVVFSQAGKLTSVEMRNKVKSIGRTLKTNGLKISETIIREKILEMYPNSEDWISDDARKDVIKVLEKQHK